MSKLRAQFVHFLLSVAVLVVGAAAQAQYSCRGLFDAPAMSEKSTTVSNSDRNTQADERALAERLELLNRARSEAIVLRDNLARQETLLELARQEARGRLTPIGLKIQKLRKLIFDTSDDLDGTPDTLATALAMYRDVFRKVEFAVRGIAECNGILAETQARIMNGSLPKSSAEEIINERDTELSSHLKNYYDNVAEYLVVRQELEKISLDGLPGDLSNSKPNEFTRTARVAVWLLDHLGDAPMQGPVSIADRPSMGEVLDTMTYLPEKDQFELQVKLARETNSIFMRVSQFVAATVKAVLPKVLPMRYGELAASIMGVSVKQLVYDEHVGNIVDILETTDASGDLQMRKIMAMAGAEHSAEFLTTFARTIEARDEWAWLKAKAKSRLENGDVAQDKWFFAQMLKADANASKMTPLSLYNRPKAASKIYAILMLKGLETAVFFLVAPNLSKKELGQLKEFFEFLIERSSDEIAELSAAQHLATKGNVPPK